MVGRPNRFASAGVRKDELRPRDTAVTEPSACVVNVPDADAFSVMAFPVLRFVYECLNEPVTRKIMDPSEALSTLMNSLLTGVVTRTLNPQNAAGRVIAGGAGKTSHLGPRPARAGEAVTTPANMPSIAPSATTTRIRLMAFDHPYMATIAAERARIPLHTPAAPPPPAGARAPYGLTGRELAVLQLVAAGRSNAQIGAELFISRATAAVHVTNIMRKLDVTNRVQAAALAERDRLLDSQQP
jgi:DNA-binding CsgD family transcriptional regulator